MLGIHGTELWLSPGRTTSRSRAQQKAAYAGACFIPVGRAGWGSTRRPSSRQALDPCTVCSCVQWQSEPSGWDRLEMRLRQWRRRWLRQGELLALSAAVPGCSFAALLTSTLRFLPVHRLLTPGIRATASSTPAPRECASGHEAGVAGRATGERALQLAAVWKAVQPKCRFAVLTAVAKCTSLPAVAPAALTMSMTAVKPVW